MSAITAGEAAIEHCIVPIPDGHALEGFIVEDNGMTFRKALDKYEMEHVRSHRFAWQLSVGGVLGKGVRYFVTMQELLGRDVYIDGSTVACKPTELCFLYTPDPGIRSGAYAPPVVAGLPCWDFSIAGKRRMEEGPTNTAFITHAKRMVEKEKLRIQMIKLLYGEHYNIKKLMTETNDAGHSGTSRERIYLILSHKKKTIEIADPVALYEKISQIMRRSVQTAPSDYMISSDGFYGNNTWPAAMGTMEVPIKDINRASSVAGNAMHFGVVGLVQMTALASYRLTGSERV
ncbi:Uncharacterized protein SCF082_LOCUS41478 [Durusdinium trenchii]|uniref:Uncharacterized protein n=1 Tax=Durusdinium trenchii TaxID=1381693 RepID=A0ABP0QHP8_9DINO